MKILLILLLWLPKGNENEILLAKMLRSECHDCSREEKASLVYIVVKRTKENYGCYGETLKEQLFKRGQFYGVRTKNFKFDPSQPLDRENLEISKKVLSGARPKYWCEDCYSFGIKGKAAIRTPSYFRHKILKK